MAYINHGGQTIRATSAGCAVGEKVFASLEEAKSYIDAGDVNTPAKVVEQKPYADQLGVAGAVKPNGAKPT